MKREHLEQVELATGRTLIEEPSVPDAGLSLWRWFWELNAGRGWAGMGPAQLSCLEIEAWARLTRETLEPWEVMAIRAMDEAYLNAVAAKEKER